MQCRPDRRHRFDEGFTLLYWVGVLLWLDGYEIAFRLVRQVFVTEARRLEGGRPMADAPEAITDQLVRKVLREAARPLDAFDLAEVADVTLIVLQSLAGKPDVVSPEGLQILADAAGGAAADAAIATATMADLVAGGLVAVAGVAKVQYDSARSVPPSGGI